MAIEIPSICPMMVDLLRVLSSEQEQLDYETEVPIADIPAELLCM